jgi:hypothetical protein
VEGEGTNEDIEDEILNWRRKDVRVRGYSIHN